MSLATSFLISGLLATAATAESRLFKHRHHARAAPVVVSVDAIVTEVVTVYVTAGAAPPAPSTTLATVSTPAAVVSVAAISSTSVASVAPVVPVSSTSSSTAAAAASSSSTSSGYAFKKGLSFNNGKLLSAWTDKNVGWAYSWGSTRDTAIPASIPFLPMIWCTNTPVSNWMTDANKAISQGSTHVLSFNEPDQPGQCQINAAAAAAGHQTYLNPLQGKAKISSPAVTNGPAPMGLGFMADFFAACAGKCVVDFLAIHWYAPTQGAVTYFKNHVTDAITLAKKNGVDQVWITEFGLTGASAADEASFLAQVLPWLNSNPNVGGYAWFMVSDGNLMSGSSISNVVGAAYASA